VQISLEVRLPLLDFSNQTIPKLWSHFDLNTTSQGVLSTFDEMAASGSQIRQKENVTQVSTWQFQSLLAAVNKLNDSVLRLEQKNEALESEFSAAVSKLEIENTALKEIVSKNDADNERLKIDLINLRKTCEGFTFFSKLPEKIRM
jgi:dynactin complex subunit